MVDPVTTNKFLAIPTSGTDVGTWDVPMNGNMTLIDNLFAGMATVSISSISSSVILSSAQYQCAFLHVTGTMGSDTTVTFPNAGGFYTVINDTAGSSVCTLIMGTTVAGSAKIGIPPNTMSEVMLDGANARFRGLPPVGTYWDYAGSSYPRWLDGCTFVPWIYCNGITFSSAVFPALADFLGSTQVPDFRGRMNFNLNGGTGRISSGGLNGDVIFSVGGIQVATLSSQNLPNTSFPVTDPGHNHTATTDAHSGSQVWSGLSNVIDAYNPGMNVVINNAVTGISVNSGGSNAPFAVTPPSIVGGIRLIRAE